MTKAVATSATKVGPHYSQVPLELECTIELAPPGARAGGFAMWWRGALGGQRFTDYDETYGDDLVEIAPDLVREGMTDAQGVWLKPVAVTLRITRTTQFPRIWYRLKFKLRRSAVTVNSSIELVDVPEIDQPDDYAG